MTLSLFRTTTLALAGAALSLALATPLQAETAAAYPSKPVRIVVPFGASSPADLSVRRLLPGLQKALAQPVVIDNKAGAAGIIASDFVAKAPADGYTLLLGTFSTHVLNVGTYKSLPYDPIDGFVPISRTNSFPNVLVVPASLGVNSVKELLERARSAPKPLSYTSGGTGTTPHLAAEMLSINAKVPLLHVPYKESGAALADLLAGRVDLTFLAISLADAHVRSGKLKALAVAGKSRSPLMSEVPTFDEAGLPNMDMSIWVGFFAPKGTPADIVAKLNRVVREVVQTEEVQQSMRGAGTQPDLDASAADFLQYLKADTPKWLQVVKAAGVEPQ